jgi:hypothetical protein
LLPNNECAAAILQAVAQQPVVRPERNFLGSSVLSLLLTVSALSGHTN